MKKQHLFILVLVSIFLFGCTSDDNRFDRYYTIENQSNHSISLKFYREGIFLDYLTTTLPNTGDQYTRTRSFQSNVANFKLPYRAYNSTDSLVIDFDNVKSQYYSIDILNGTFSDPIERNVYRHENYENIGKERFLFKITEEDYNNAEDI